ncbi:MAG TPA: hypothetical protein VHG51_11135 [Longimicrobiaceae bacterium]|nr:hypothetical protein [Longimicrobiaceae bacterium]
MSRSLGEGTGGPAADAGKPSQPGPRKEVGDAASSRLHPPHVTENAEAAPVQDESGGAEIPTLPANSHGRDRTEMTEQPGIDPESMYEHRPGEDKDTPPSETGGQ